MPPPPPATGSRSRRGWLAAASALATGVAFPAPAMAQGQDIGSGSGFGGARIAPPLQGASFSDLNCRVSAGRLNALVEAIFPAFNAPAILPAFDPNRHGARCDVELHRLVAPLVVPETGESITLSGLLAVPVGVKGPIPVVSWQHGTILSFDSVPSGLLKLADPSYITTDQADSLETLLNVHRFAGQGFAVIAADYVGKGPFRNGRGEGYAVKAVTTQACLRMLEAGQRTLNALGLETGPLFLNGWSQGGLNTQWLHQALRRLGIAVTGTSVSSPFNELSETMRFWSGVGSYPPVDGQSSYPAMPPWISLCMIILIGSYELHYGMKGLLRSAVAPGFRGMAETYWKTYDVRFALGKPFPTGATLLVPGFFDRFTDDLNSAFLRRLAANTATFWEYDAPIRFHLGLADEALHPTLVRRAIAAGGAKTAEVPVKGGSHRGNFLASLYGDGTTLAGRENAVDWFKSLL